MPAPESPASTDALQTQPPEPPLAALHIPDGILVAPNVTLPPNSTVWTKLYLLLHAHQLAVRAARRVLLLRLLLFAFALSVAIPLGILSGTGVFWLLYDDPHQHAQYYYAWGANPDTYYVRGRKVSQQEYDYYLHTNGNEPRALVAAIPFGIFIGVAIAGTIWLILRPRKPLIYTTIEEQIAAIAKDHPEAVAGWGGLAVLRVQPLIERLLDMQAKDARR
jgi:hypothetical protein